MNEIRQHKWFAIAIVMTITLLAVQSANAEYGPEDTNGPKLSYHSGRILLRFKPIGTGEMSTQNAVLSAAGGGNIITDYQDLVPGLVLLELPEGKTVEDNLDDYATADGVMYAEPDYEFNIAAETPDDAEPDYRFNIAAETPDGAGPGYEFNITATTPDDTYFSDLWGMHNTGQTGGTSDADIDATETWDIRTSASSIVVAVIDTGVDYDHEDLEDNMWVNTAELNGTASVDDDNNGYVDDIYGYDFYNNDGDPDDDNSHGTYCAGPIGAIGNNSTGVVGVCWEVQIMAVKCFNAYGSGYLSTIIPAIIYAKDMGADVMSNSWGSGGFSQALKDTIFAAGQEDIIFVAEAGSQGSNNNDTNPFYPATYNLDNIISVAATDHDDDLASFSHYGAATVDLAAPGVNIKSCALSDTYGTRSGTCMATPHVAGACALYWAGNPGNSFAEVKAALLDSVDVITSMSGKCVSEGRLNLYNLLAAETPSGDIDPSTFNGWNEIDDFMAFYMLNSSGNGYFGAKKYVKATYAFIDGHCTTAKGTQLPHYHFEASLNGTQQTDSNRYWDWYYSTIGGSYIRQSNAGISVASLASALDGYGTYGDDTASYNYWLVPSEETDSFTEDLVFWQGPPHDCRAGDRILYNDDDYVFQQATIVNSVDGNNEPDQIEWKCQHSGVYRWNNGAALEQFATPACPGTQPDGSAPTGNWDPDYWDTDVANIYHD